MMNFVICLFISIFLMILSGILLVVFSKEGNQDNLWAAMIGFITSLAFLHTAIKNRSEAKKN
jgi:uncharacterized protein with PQ loop repeat